MSASPEERDGIGCAENDQAEHTFTQIDPRTVAQHGILPELSRCPDVAALDWSRQLPTAPMALPPVPRRPICRLLCRRP
jgi:hypothetical protein